MHQHMNSLATDAHVDVDVDVDVDVEADVDVPGMMLSGVMMHVVCNAFHA